MAERTEKEVFRGSFVGSASPCRVVRLSPRDAESLRQFSASATAIGTGTTGAFNGQRQALLIREDALAEARSAWPPLPRRQRPAAAEESWREQAQAELTTAIQRYKQAEADFAETLPAAGKSAARGTKSKYCACAKRWKISNQRSQCVTSSCLRRTQRLSRCASDWTWKMKSAASLNRGRRMPDKPGLNVRRKRPIWRDIALVAAVAAFGILLYPRPRGACTR